MSITVTAAKSSHRKEGLSNEISPIFIKGIAWKGDDTQVFGYFGKPQGCQEKRPAILLIHGGDGRAYDEWVDMWVKKGFIVLAPDLNAQMYGKDGDFTENSFGGPKGYGSFTDDLGDIENCWTRFCVRLLKECAEYLKGRADVDEMKLFVHGISWGGYLTYHLLSECNLFTLAGISYTTAYLYLDPYWKAAGLTEKDMGANYERWLKSLDPKNHIPKISTPCIWARGINDAAFSSELVNATLDLFKENIVTPVFYREYLHNQEDGCCPPEIVAAIENAAIPKPNQSHTYTYSVVYTKNRCEYTRDCVWEEETIAQDEYLRYRKEEWSAWYFNKKDEKGLITSTRVFYDGV